MSEGARRPGGQTGPAPGATPAPRTLTRARGTVVRSARLDAADLEEVRRPWAGLVLEEEVEPGLFRGVGGQGGWDRRVEVLGEPDADGLAPARQTIDYRLDIPGFAGLFGIGWRAEAKRFPLRRGLPWWAPPDRLDARATQTVAALALLSLICGYLGTLITQTIGFATDDFGVGNQGRGIALAAARADVVIAVGWSALADRRGRRPILLWAAGLAIAFTALSGLAPNLPSLVLLQIPARGMSAAVFITVGVLAAEEVPAGARAWTASVLAMVAALGSGICVATLPLADLGAGAWRLSYLFPLVFLLVLRRAARSLGESRRFDQAEQKEREADVAEVEVIAKSHRLRDHKRRLAVLGLAGYLGAIFLAPAAQFQNSYLADERGFSAARITLFTLLTGTPGGIGVVVGGRLADTRGRRRVAAVGIALFAVGIGASFVTRGWLLWATAMVGGVFGGMTVPALAVYGPELFPTALRGRANGLISGISRAGSVTGLLAVGFVSSRYLDIGQTVALLALTELLVVAVILLWYPETADHTLEELNPEDAALGLG